MDDVEYKGYTISIRTVKLEVGGYMASASIIDRSGNTETAPFDSAAAKTEEEAAQVALQEARAIIDDL